MTNGKGHSRSGCKILRKELPCGGLRPVSRVEASGPRTHRLEMIFFGVKGWKPWLCANCSFISGLYVQNTREKFIFSTTGNDLI